MSILVSSGSVATSSAAASITVSSASAVAGNKLVLLVSWYANAATSAVTPTAPTGWTPDRQVAGAFSTGNGASGFSVYSKIAAAGVNTVVFNAPSGGSVYAHAQITEWFGMGNHDSNDSSALVNNTAAASTTGTTIPDTGTLNSTANAAVIGLSIVCGTGSTNANIVYNGGSWSSDFSSQNTSTDIGVLDGKQILATSHIGGSYKWDADTSMLQYQAGIVVYNDVAGNMNLQNQRFTYRPYKFAPASKR